ncbi:MAG: HAMP domain-containing protein, partial [Lachnospiraceae bacterium]|nr:HAMP domain-containing protein [Lachnospiraceae bacterium]
VVRDSKVGMFLGHAMDEARLASRLENYVFGTVNGELIGEKDQYRVYQAYDPLAGATYMEVHGMLADDYIFLMRTPLQAIQESVLISNRFYLYVGLSAIFLGSLIIYVATRRLTEPILHLSSLAEQMSRLDFAARYEGRGKDELAILGGSMNRMSDQLEKTISELKTANLELQHDLEQRNRMDEMRNEFISGVSHELKTPISLIQGYAEGLKEGMVQDPENMEYYCDVIMDEAGRMNRMVKKLLTLNQIEFGSETPSIEHFDVAALIRSLLQPYQRTIEQERIRVDFEAPQTYVWADEFMIEEVLSNYLSNAFHYVKGENRIEIRILMLTDGVRICVFNSGDPIPEEEKDRVWEKFYKVDKARSREYDGNGIGLSIVKAIMDKHGKPYGLTNYSNGVAFWIELDSKSN